MKRFYLYKSIHAYKPRIMMITCLVMAIKAEEVNCDLLSHVEGIDIKKVIEYEASLFEGVKFQVHVYSPFDSLEGFRLAFGIDNKFIGEKIIPLIMKSYMTDAILLFTPGIIAMTAIFILDRKFVEKLSLPEEKMLKIKEASELMASMYEPTQKDYISIAARIQRFEQACPELMKYMEETKKQRMMSTDKKRKSAEGENIHSMMQKKFKLDDKAAFGLGQGMLPGPGTGAMAGPNVTGNVI